MSGTVLKVYRETIEDVVSNVRELFLEDGVDEQVLQELKQLWENKLMATKACDIKSDADKQGAAKKAGESSTSVQTNGSQQKQMSAPATAQGAKQVVAQVTPNNHVQTAAFALAQAEAQNQALLNQALLAQQNPHPQQNVVHTHAHSHHARPLLPQPVTTPEIKMIPIQITLPVQPGVEKRILTIQVPQTALQGNTLHKVLTGPVITATMSLPNNIACQLLQQHVNAAFTTPQASSHFQKFSQNDGAHGSGILPMLKKQTDGPLDTSDEDDDDDDDEPSDDNDDDLQQDLELDMGPEEEPLNSDDDVTDEDPLDLFDCENVVVCQYDKITRSRNKWKFTFKDGIMNLDGVDYLFQKANGDAEW